MIDDDLPSTDEMLMGLLLSYEVELWKGSDSDYTFNIAIQSPNATLSASFHDVDEIRALRKTIGSVYRQAIVLANLRNQGKI